MTKRITLLLAALVLLMTAVPALHAAEPSRPVLIGFSQDTLANDWRVAQAEGLRQAFARYPNIRFVVTDGRGNTARQIRDVEDLVNMKVDVLMVSPRDSLAMTPVIKAAYRRGIPVVLITRTINSDDYTSFVAPDDALIARDAARYMAQTLAGKGKILILQGVPTATTARARTEAFEAELRHYPGMHVAALKVGNYLRSDAIRAVEEVLQQRIAFNAIYAQSDSMAAGARVALRQAGRDPRTVLTVGIDYIAEARQAIRSGEQSASFVYPTCAREAAAVALSILRGKAVPKRVLVTSEMVTRDNVEQVAPIF